MAIYRKRLIKKNLSIGVFIMTNAQSAEACDESTTVCKTLEISAEEFSVFEFFLDKIKLKFNDFSLVNGAFRSYSNDKSYIIETGFPFFSDVSFDITKIKDKMKSVSTFRKKNCVNFNFNDTGYKIDDGTYSLDFISPDPDFIDNKFISYEEMEQLVLKNVDPNKIIFREGIDRKRALRAKQLLRKLSSKSIHLKKVKSSSNEVSLVIPVKSDESVIPSINLKQPLLMPLREKYFLKLPAFPFNFYEDHLYITCYFNYDQTVTTMFSTKVNNLWINFYSQSELSSEDK
jgi:hypothetical protein